MLMTMTTPALLFPAISLLLLAYTNRFLVLAQLIRQLNTREGGQVMAPGDREWRVAKEREAKGDLQEKLDRLTQELDVKGLELQRAGGKRLGAADFLRGFAIVRGQRLGGAA